MKRTIFSAVLTGLLLMALISPAPAVPGVRTAWAGNLHLSGQGATDEGYETPLRDCGYGSVMVGLDATWNNDGLLTSLRPACAVIAMVGSDLETGDVVTMTKASGPVGPNAGSYRCATGDVMNGLHFHLSNVIEGIHVRCSNMVGTETDGAPTEGPLFGTDGGDDVVIDCPYGGFLTAMRIDVKAYATGKYSTRQIQGTCHDVISYGDYQPDLAIGNEFEDVYLQEPPGALWTTKVRAGKYATVGVEISNDGDQTDFIFLKGSKGTSRFDVRYDVDDRNRTYEMVRGQWFEEPYAGGVGSMIYLSVKTDPDLPRGAKYTGLIEAQSTASMEARDIVQFRVVIR